MELGGSAGLSTAPLRGPEPIRLSPAYPQANEAVVTISRFHLHLVSDSTGETVHALARACLAQFPGAEAIEHIWSMVRTRAQIDRVIAGVDANPGVVLYTIVNETLRQPLQECCRVLDVPAIPVLDPAIGALGACPASSTRSITNISSGSTP
jgi:regulator of PEP synthase PpsR (kinase-PPPase family)